MVTLTSAPLFRLDIFSPSAVVIVFNANLAMKYRPRLYGISAFQIAR